MGTVAVAGGVASNIIANLTASHTNSSTALTQLQGLVQNLLSAGTATGQRAIATQILMTPNAGVAGQIAEKLINDLEISDPTTRSLAVMQDISYIQAAVAAMAHSTGILSSFLSSLGL